MRRWRAGRHERVGGVDFRAVHGTRGDDDLRLEWLIGGEWQPFDLTVLLLAADFLCENEDVLHPPPQKGGRYLLDYVRHASRHGFEKAAAGVRATTGAPQEAMFS